MSLHDSAASPPADSGCFRAKSGSVLTTPNPNEVDVPASVHKIQMDTEVSEEDMPLRARGMLDSFSTARFPAVVFVHLIGEKEKSPGCSNTLVKAFLCSATPIFPSSNWFWEELRQMALSALLITGPYSWMLEQDLFQLRDEVSFSFQAMSLLDREVVTPVSVTLPLPT